MPVSPHFKRWQEVNRTAITQPNPGRRERLLSRRYLFRRVLEDILLKLLNCTESFMRRPPMNIHQLLNQSIRGLSDRAANGIDNLVVPRECRQPQSPESLSVRLFHDSTLDYRWFCSICRMPIRTRLAHSLTYRRGPAHLLQPIDLSAFHFSRASCRVIS